MTNYPLRYAVQMSTGKWCYSENYEHFLTKESAKCEAMRIRALLLKNLGFCVSFSIIKLEGNIVENGTGLCIPKQTIVSTIDELGNIKEKI